jgi:hypothetical protein
MEEGKEWGRIWYECNIQHVGHVSFEKLAGE